MLIRIPLLFAMLLIKLVPLSGQSLVRMTLNDIYVTLQKELSHTSTHFDDFSGEFRIDSSAISMPSDAPPETLCTVIQTDIWPDLNSLMFYEDPQLVLYYNESVIVQGATFISVLNSNTFTKTLQLNYNLQKAVSVGSFADLTKNFMWIDDKNSVLLILKGMNLTYSKWDLGSAIWGMLELSYGFQSRAAVEAILSVDGYIFAAARSVGVDVYNQTLRTNGNVELIMTLNGSVLNSTASNQANDVCDLKYYNGLLYILDQINGVYALNVSGIENLQSIAPIISQNSCYRMEIKGLALVLACLAINNGQYPIYEYTLDPKTLSYKLNRVVYVNHNVTELLIDDYYVYVQSSKGVQAFPHSVAAAYEPHVAAYVLMTGISGLALIPNKPYYFIVAKSDNIEIANIVFVAPSINCYNNGKFPVGDYVYNITAFQRTCNDLPNQSSIEQSCSISLKLTASIKDEIFGDETTALAVGLSVGLSVGIVIISLLIWRLRKNKKEMESLKLKYVQLGQRESPQGKKKPHDLTLDASHDTKDEHMDHHDHLQLHGGSRISPTHSHVDSQLKSIALDTDHEINHSSTQLASMSSENRKINGPSKFGKFHE
jgi:hypothetical protein